MLRTGISAALVVVILVAAGTTSTSPAGPAPLTRARCELAVDTFKRDLHEYWVDAGQPPISCVAGEPWSGLWKDGTVLVNITGPVPRALGAQIGYAAVLAHELGHAWATQHSVDYSRFAHLRGYPEDGATVPIEWLVEDFADTVQLWVRQYATGPTNDPPYGFEVPPGIPTRAQLLALRDAGLLPPETARASEHLCESRPRIRCLRPAF